ncbi:DnaD domain protein [Areca yellow leaf disease phytoplasma]|uniref:DnaD domain protein n=1 Tax=Areca yellow leaf disease phytoplasma TaxID=927614 RepID=UPI0035B560D6
MFRIQQRTNSLTSNELDLVRNWYQDQEFSHEEIKNTIEEALCVKKTLLFFKYINTSVWQKEIFDSYTR